LFLGAIAKTDATWGGDWVSFLLPHWFTEPGKFGKHKLCQIRPFLEKNVPARSKQPFAPTVEQLVSRVFSLPEIT
jgi:hypothetical protein